MELLLAIVIAYATAWFISNVAAGSIESAVSALARFVGGWRGDGWPRGVQEENRDRPWGSAAAPARSRRLSIPDLKPTLSRVKPEVRPR